MLKINSTDCFDLNLIGFVFTIVIGILTLFFAINLWIIFCIELLLIIYVYFLFNQIKKNKNLSILINIESKWFISSGINSSEVELKDYWILSGLIFFWLKGDKYSVSFVVRRSIIGAQNFSQLRANII